VELGFSLDQYISRPRHVSGHDFSHAEEGFK
jgi:hypothetical protein